MRTGYFWLTMETDCCQFVQRCPECQIHGDLIHVPPSELHALTSPWPFSVWGIDIIGKISPKSSSGHEFILVAIDYFTKWVEAASYARLTSSGVASFIRSHIICRYGVPHELISDRGVHFRAEVDTLVQRYSIRHHRSTAYRPQTNGAVEAANKNIKRILRKMVETSRDWSTPYSLVYGMEAVLPVEIEMGSLRVALEQQIPETDWAQARFDQLNLLDERRLRAADHVRAYQRKMARAFKSGSSPDHCMELTPRGRCMADGFRWKPVLRADQCGSAKEVLCLRPWSQDGWPSFRLICFICLLVDTMFTLGTIRSMAHGIYCTCCISYMRAWVLIIGYLSLVSPSFLSPYHPSLHYVPCLKTTLRPWDQISSSTASMWTDAILGHIPFRKILWIFAEGHISVRMRFTDHEGVACLSLFARSRFILFDIVVIPGWGYVECLDPHVIISVRYTSGLLCIPMVLFSGHQGRSVVHRSRLVEPLLAIHSSLRFAAACHTGAYFPHIVSLQSGVQSRRSFTVYDIQSHHVTFFSLVFRATSQFDVQSHHHHFLVSAFRAITASQFRRSEPSSVFRSTFRVRVLGFGVQSRYHFSASVFRAIITTSLSFGVQSHHRLSDRHSESILGFGVQSRHRFSDRRSESRFRFRRSESLSLLSFGVQSHHHFSVSAFRAVIGFQIDVQSRVLGFGVQSRYHFSASVFRAIITTSLSFGVQSRHRFSDRRSESRSRFRRSESLSLLSFGVQSHHHYFSQFRRSESSSVFRSTFRVAFSVSAFRVVITSQLRCSEPSSLLLSVSAFRVVIGFSDRRLESRSRFRRSESLSLLSFGVQSHHHYFSQFRRSELSSVSDRRSESRSRFRRSESLSLLSFGVQSHHHYFSQFRRSESSSVFRSTFRVPSSVSAFRVVITSQFDVQSHHHHFSVSAFRAIIGFQIDIQSRILGFSVQSRYHFSV
ncbi:Pol polyprotein [Vitis vinifera]|uniref:Pol polyprotein n=1 Tax=Vitis vinifera TaxID=29760 RepID=A0A438I2V9_VITVI|nr:Pol polyprotein [Vitis vinifera]